MRLRIRLHVPGGTTHLIPAPLLDTLQHITADFEAATYPLVIQVGSPRFSRLQPVVASALLAEVEHLSPRLQQIPIPGISFRNDGHELGRIYHRTNDSPITHGDKLSLSVDSDGIRITLEQFPPPAGFRSRPALRAGEYECYFQRITYEDTGCLGQRTEAMGRPDIPIRLPAVPLPAVTHWDVATVAGNPHVSEMEFVTAPAREVYRDVLHALSSAATESLRSKVPLYIQPE